MVDGNRYVLTMMVPYDSNLTRDGNDDAVQPSLPTRSKMHCNHSDSTRSINKTDRGRRRSRKRDSKQKAESSRIHHLETEIESSLLKTDLLQNLHEDGNRLILTNRWILWASSCVSSFVSTFTIATSVPLNQRSDIDNITLALTVVSLVVCGATAGSFFRRAMHPKLDKAETVIVFFLVCVWGFAVYLTMGANSTLAVSGPRVWNWNVFSSVWISYWLVVFLFCHLMVSDCCLLVDLQINEEREYN